MLQTRTVTPELLELLHRLMLIPDFKSFNLVGGTSLALQLGHRTSIDIDLFGSELLDHQNIIDNLEQIGNVYIPQQTKNILITEVGNIKVDFVCYRYPWIEDIKIIDGIRLAGLKDIAAMKISAITQRGSKKDFIDLYFLLQHFTFSEIMDFYCEKITDGNVFLAQKSLTYFDDAESQPLPKVYEPDFTWEKCKKLILSKVEY